MKRFWSNFAILSITFVLSFDLTIINTALHELHHVFSIDVSEIHWLINSFGLGLSCFMITMGRAADYWGSKKTLFFGIALFILASVVAGISSEYYTLIGARFFLGVASAVLYPVTQLLMYQNYPEHQKKKAIALWVTSLGVGLTTGPFLGGFFVTYLSWRYIFFVPAALLVMSSVLIYFFVQNTKVNMTKKVHPLEVILLFLGLGALILAIGLARNYSFLSWRIITLFILSILLFLLLIFFEKRLEDPIIPVLLLKNPVFLLTSILSGSLSLFTWSILFLVPLFLQKVYAFSAFYAGLYTMFFAAAFILSGQIASVIGHLISTKKFILISYGFYTTSLAIQGFAPFNFVLLAISLILFGFAGPFLQSNSVPLALSYSKKQDLGSVLGFIRTIQTSFGMIGVVICSSIISHFTFIKAYHISFIVLTMCSIFLALCVCWIIPGKKNKTA